jgi:3-carboxy-cis,cis-muconate cycloisomerase
MFDGLYAHGAAAATLTDTAWLQAMLDVEAAIARASAALGEIPVRAAEQITEAARGQRFGAAALAAIAVSEAENATPVLGLVAMLRDAVGPDARDHVHAGATSQDVVDTALMLLAQRARARLLADARRGADAAARLAAAHRDTPVIGRTLMQQALPTTFGLRAAGWLTEIDGAAAALAATELPVQMGGPIGGRDPAVAARVAAELGLTAPVMGWATDRVAPARLACALGVLAGAVAKISRDVTLLASTEIGEIHDARAGGSSAMSHKRNPVAAVSALACARRTPGLVATMLAAMESEHERAAGAWQAEWGTLVALLGLTGSATAWAAELLDGLQLDDARMAENLRAAPTAARPLPDGAGELVDRALRAHRELG